MSAFWSRLTLIGDYILDSPVRIGNGSDGIVLDATGKPIIPGSTVRGALRTYLEAMLHGMYDDSQNAQQSITLRGADGRPTTQTRIVKLCCESADKNQDDANYQGCLTKAIVTKWEADPLLRANLDSALYDCSCAMCRLFGAAWLASRVYIADMTVSDWSGEFLTRGGMALNREQDIALSDSFYQHQAIPPGTHCTFRLTADNLSPLEQGLIFVGIRAFEAGMITLGADRARGFGRGRLAVDWWNCRYIDSDHLIEALLGADPQPLADSDIETGINALTSILRQP